MAGGAGGAPAKPVAPVAGGAPAKPVAPVAGGAPAKPVAPVAGGAPANPVAPVAGGAPAKPVAPVAGGAGGAPAKPAAKAQTGNDNTSPITNVAVFFTQPSLGCIISSCCSASDNSCTSINGARLGENPATIRRI